MSNNIIKMNKLKNLPISLFVIVVLLFSCKNNSQTSDKNTSVEVISTTAFKAKVAGTDVQLVDVRTPEEFSEGHLKNSKNIDFKNDNFMAQMEKLDKSKPLYLYCRSGNRSGKASAKLKEAGFTEIYDMKGGFLAWSKENLEIAK